MDKLIEIAQIFYKRFEGKDLYPSFLSWQWIGWFALAPVFACSIGYAFYCIITNQPILKIALSSLGMIVAECAFLQLNTTIDSYKNQHQNQRFKLSGPDVKPQLKEAKRQELTKLLKQQPTSFLVVAKEIGDLKTAKKDFSQPVIGFWRGIFDVDAKPRLIAITLGACAITAAMLSRAIESNAIFELIASDRIYVVLFLCTWLALIAHFSIYGIRLAYQVVSGKVMEWLLRLGWSKAANKIALNYMVNSLIDLYEPTKAHPRRLRPFKVRQRKNIIKN